MEFYENLKKVYKKLIFITDILFNFILSHAMLTEWYNRDISLISSIPWLLLGLSFFITAVRTILRKPPIFLPLFKQIKTILLTFIFSLVFLIQYFQMILIPGYDYGMSSTPFLLVGLLFLTISITICIRKILKKPSLGELFKQFRSLHKK